MSVMSLLTALFACFVALWGLIASRLEGDAFRAGSAPARKLVAHGVTMLLLWVMAAIALRLYGWSPLMRPVATVTGIAGPLLLPLLTAFAAIALLPLVQSLRGPRWRIAYAAAIRREYSDIPGFIPENGRELLMWVGISLTAGFCEEILYRGFLIRYLYEAPGLPLALALALSSICFGLGHAYHGAKGIGTATVSGFGFGLLFLVSGSLIPSILLHMLMDLQMVYVMRPVPEPGVGG